MITGSAGSQGFVRFKQSGDVGVVVAALVVVTGAEDVELADVAEDVKAVEEIAVGEVVVVHSGEQIC